MISYCEVIIKRLTRGLLEQKLCCEKLMKQPLNECFQERYFFVKRWLFSYCLVSWHIMYQSFKITFFINNSNKCILSVHKKNMIMILQILFSACGSREWYSTNQMLPQWGVGTTCCQNKGKELRSFQDLLVLLLLSGNFFFSYCQSIHVI